MKRVPRDISVHLYRRDGNGARFLMLHRTPERGGFWQGVTGAPLTGESDEAAAVREVREETGHDVAGLLEPIGSYSYALRSELAERWRELYGPGVDSIAVVAFGADVSGLGDPKLDPGEHDSYEWVAYDVALGRLDWPIESDALADRRRVLAQLNANALTR